MDGGKDTRIANLSSFFEKTPAKLSIPLNQPADRLFRRSERIAAGVFLATNHLPPTDALRQQTREAILQLLHLALTLRDEMRNQQSAHVVQFKATARYAVSLIRMLAVAGQLSIQNASVLVEALDELGTFITTAQSSPLSDTVSLTRQDLLDAQTPPIRVKDSIKDNVSVKDSNAVSDTQAQRKVDVRKENVLDVLRSGGAMGIVDICAYLPEYSTKMIQRDLAELVSAGKVIKTGDKRWSRYALAGAIQ